MAVVLVYVKWPWYSHILYDPGTRICYMTVVLVYVIWPWYSYMLYGRGTRTCYMSVGSAPSLSTHYDAFRWQCVPATMYNLVSRTISYTRFVGTFLNSIFNNKDIAICDITYLVSYHFPPIVFFEKTSIS